MGKPRFLVTSLSHELGLSQQFLFLFAPMALPSSSVIKRTLVQRKDVGGVKQRETARKRPIPSISLHFLV